MKNRAARCLLSAVALLLLVGASTVPAHAESETLPPAAEILDAFVEATGGRTAYDRIDNRVTHAALEIVGQGMTLDVTIYAARPGVNYTIVESEMTGKITKGTDGEVVWESSAMMGPQIKDGQEKLDFLRESTFDKQVVWREIYAEAETVGIQDVDGRPTFKIVVKPPDGKPQAHYFDCESKLAVKVEFTVDNPVGTIPMEFFPGDYREVDGLLLPHVVKIQVMGQQRVMRTKSIEQNVDLPADRFTLPSEVRALLDDAPADAAAGESG